MKILVSDFDGTIFNENFEKNIEMINNFISQGNTFIIATGRTIEGLKKIIDYTNLQCQYYICSDGAVIYDSFLNIIYRKDINPASVEDIIKILDSYPEIDYYIDTTHGLSKDTSHSANRILIKYQDKLLAQQILDKICNSTHDIYGYISQNWINIGNSSCSKGNAINYLIDNYHLNRNDIITIGNGANDKSMAGFQSYIIKNDEYTPSTENIINSFEELLVNINKK